MSLVILILKKKFSGFVRGLSLPNPLLFHGGTMVELHCVPPLANLHHKLLAGTLKQR